MYYQNTIQGYQNPGVVIPPSGYNVNTQYQAYGQNLVPMPMQNPNMMPNNSDMESRLAKIERQINRLDHRISKLEANSNTIIDDYDSNTTNMYML